MRSPVPQFVPPQIGFVPSPPTPRTPDPSSIPNWLRSPAFPSPRPNRAASPKLASFHTPRPGGTPPLGPSPKLAPNPRSPLPSTKHPKIKDPANPTNPTP